MIIIELAYSFHLGSDKNKRNTSRSSAKSNKSGSTSLSNNAIQNSAGLTKVDKHNYRKYDNNQNDIEIIKGSSSLVDDVKKLYKEEFDEAKEEYNLKQIRDDRKIKDYFTHISNNEKNDLSAVMQIWLDINIKAHSFISKHYWMDNYDMVKKILPQAEIYVYENNGTKEIEGFIGLTDNYIAGLFVKEDMQSKGIGTQLLNYAKGIKSNMYLSVYNKNIRAIQFYQREQFVVQSENTDDNTNEKELIMAWSR